MQEAVHSLSIAMANAADLAQGRSKFRSTPALQKLPEISQQVQSAVTHANSVMAGLDSNFGSGSDFDRSAKRVLDQVNDAARSIRMLADYLERHPEALLSGKSGDEKSEKSSGDKPVEKDKP